MAVVKGSKIERLVVVPHRPWRSLLLFCLALTCVAASAVMSYHYSKFRGANLVDELETENGGLTYQISDLNDKLLALRQKVATISSGADVDKKAIEEVRLANKALQEEKAELVEQINFYRGLMEPKGSQKGLSIRNFNIFPTTMKTRYRYKLIIQQLAAKEKVLVGYANILINGSQAGIKKTYSIHELSQQESQKDIKLRFRYFQVLEGEVELPEGFKPESIMVLAESRGRDPQKLEKNFGWLINED